MNRLVPARAALCGTLCLALAGAAVAAEPEAAAPGIEPRVQRTVVDDGGTRIEELRVRGQLQRVRVTPKGQALPYEILTGDGGSPAADSANGSSASRSGSGKRVWHVLSF